jgi:hypothetical protein
MANRYPSWRERRWNLFLQRYQNEPSLRLALHDFYKDNSHEIRVDTIGDLLKQHGVDTSVCFSVLSYLENPNLKAKEYMKYILPPVVYWNAYRDEVGPGLNM